MLVTLPWVYKISIMELLAENVTNMKYSLIGSFNDNSSIVEFNILIKLGVCRFHIECRMRNDIPSL